MSDRSLADPPSPQQVDNIENIPPNNNSMNNNSNHSLSNSNKQPIGGIFTKYKQSGLLLKARRSYATSPQPAGSLNSNVLPMMKDMESMMAEDAEIDDPVMTYNPNADDNISMASSHASSNNNRYNKHNKAKSGPVNLERIGPSPSAPNPDQRLSPKIGPVMNKMSRGDSVNSQTPEFKWRGYVKMI